MTRRELEALQWGRLLAGLSRVLASNAFYQKKFDDAGIGLSDLQSLSDLCRIPFTVKEEILADQEAHPPYGSNLTEPVGRYVRIHQTSGTSGRRLRWLDTPENWDWILSLWDAIYEAAAIASNDRFFFPFSFGPFLGFWAAFEGACRRGHFTMAGGGMTSGARLQAILDNRVSVVCCTPTHALHLSEVAEKEGIELGESAVRMLIVAGEPGGCLSGVRERLECSWGARVIDHSGMTEIGSLGIEFFELPSKLYLLEDQCIAEFLEPGSDRTVGEGELGELVITPLGRWDSPLFRYRTGDICRWRRSPHPSGKPFVHLDGGVLGRTDDMLWIKGNNVYPSALESVLRSEPMVGEYQIEVDSRSSPPSVTLVLESTNDSVGGTEFCARIGRLFQDRLYFRPDIRVVAFGTLPRSEMKSRRIVRIGSEDRNG